jgi:hypothetical protein
MGRYDCLLVNGHNPQLAVWSNKLEIQFYEETKGKMEEDPTGKNRRRRRDDDGLYTFACCFSWGLLFLLLIGAGTTAILVPLLVGNSRSAVAATTTSPAPVGCVPSDLIYVAYDDLFFGPGITYRPPTSVYYGSNSTLGLMDPVTGVITPIGQMAGVPFYDCNYEFCYGSTVRSLYMGPDQQLYGTAWEMTQAVVIPTWLFKIDPATANSVAICEFLPYYLNYKTIGIGIDSSGIMYWKVPGDFEVMSLDLSTCAVSIFSAPFNATSATLYFDKLYFITDEQRLLRIDLPNPTVIDTGLTVDVFYNIPNTIECYLDDMCWAPTTFFPYIDAGLNTSLRAAYGSLDATYEPFVTINETTGDTSIFLNRSITSTAQIVYGAAPTCYHDISVQIHSFARKWNPVVTPGVITFSSHLPDNSSLISEYDPTSKTIHPLGKVAGVLLVKTFSDTKRYGLSVTGELFTLEGVTATRVCLPNVSAVYGFHESDILVEKDGFIRTMDPVSCALGEIPIAEFSCGQQGIILGSTLYCVSTTAFTSIDVSSSPGVVSNIGSTSFSALPNLFPWRSNDAASPSIVWMDATGTFETISVTDASVIPAPLEPFGFYSTRVTWYPLS